MKTLKEQVDEIVKSNKSKQTKSVSLVKLGLSPYEVTLLLGSIKVQKGCKFNANNLTFGVECETYNVLRDALIREVSKETLLFNQRVITIEIIISIIRLFLMLLLRAQTVMR